MKRRTAKCENNHDETESVFTSAGYNTEDEAALAYNVAAFVFEGRNAEVNQGMKLTLERKKQIELETLERLKVFLKLPRDFKFGRFPELYDEPPSGFEVGFNQITKVLKHNL